MEKLNNAHLNFIFLIPGNYTSAKQEKKENKSEYYQLQTTATGDKWLH